MQYEKCYICTQKYPSRGFYWDDGIESGWTIIAGDGTTLINAPDFLLFCSMKCFTYFIEGLNSLLKAIKNVEESKSNPGC